MSNTRSLIIGIFVIIVLIVGAIVLVRFLRSGRDNGTNNPTPTTAVTATPGSGGSSITLTEQNNSNISGTVRFDEADGQVRITLNLQEYPEDTLQPANIYMGTCNEPGSVLYPLAPTFNGQSVSTLETSRERLNNQKPLVIGVTKSQGDTQLATCGSL